MDHDFPLHFKKNQYGYFDPLRDYSCGYFNTEKDIKDDIIKHREISKDLLSKADIMILTIGQNDYVSDTNDNFFWGHHPSEDYLNKNVNDLSFGEISFSNNVDNLLSSLKKIRLYNKNIKFLITLSPVPSSVSLIDENAVVKSFETKALLRTCIKHLLDIKNELNITYFPIFEYLICFNPEIYMPDNRHIKKKYIRKVFNLLKKNIKKD